MDVGTILRRRGVLWKSTLDVITSVVMIGAAVIVVSSHLSKRTHTPPDLKIPSAPLSIDGVARRGSVRAPTVIITFSDFECPFCGRFARETLPLLERDYVATGLVQLVFRHLPLPIHQHAMKAAQAVQCAGEQGRFWPMHDRLFSRGATLDDAGLRAVAAMVGVEGRRFATCLNDPSVTAYVSRDMQEAKALGLTSTPSFLIGSRLLDGRVSVTRAFSGARPFEVFRETLDRSMSVSLWRRLFS